MAYGLYNQQNNQIFGQKYSVASGINDAYLAPLGTGGKIVGDIISPASIWKNHFASDQPQMQQIGGVVPGLNDDMQRQKMLSSMYMNSFNKDLQTGGNMANKLIPQGAYGRLDTSGYNTAANLAGGRLGGYTSPENQGLRDAQNRQDLSGYATARDQLQKSQGYNGVRGATASYQAQKLARQFDESKIASNQNLMVQNVGQKEKALQNYTSALGARDTAVGANNANQEKELNARLGVQFGYGQMGAANRAAAAGYFANADALNLQKENINAQNQFTLASQKGGKK